MNIRRERLELECMTARQIRRFQSAGIPFGFRARLAIGRAGGGLSIRRLLTPEFVFEFSNDGVQ